MPSGAGAAAPGRPRSSAANAPASTRPGHDERGRKVTLPPARWSGMPCGGPASTPADLARSGALALAAAAAGSRSRGLLLPAALGPLLGRHLFGLLIGIG